MSYIKRIFVIICVFISCIQFVAAQDKHKNEQTVLVINSYNENSAWALSMLKPINSYIAQNDSLHIEMVNLESTLITDSVTYNKVKDHVMATYKNRDIGYVVFIGNLAFTLRDEIRDAKGDDIPMLLITRDLTMAPDEYYFSGYEDNEMFDKAFPSIAELRPDYNFTAVCVPDFYKETIDLMISLMPDMNRLYYMSDAIYFNRILYREIEDYLMTEYPDLEFEWLQASADNYDSLQYYMVNRMPNTGFLLSSWQYETMGVFGYPTLMSGFMSLLQSSSNPIFTMRETYMSVGSVGGVYPNLDEVYTVINTDIEAMFSGQSMRDIGFYVSKGAKEPTINYPLFKQYGLDEKNCPDGVVFVDKPLTFWEEYHWQMIAVVLVIALLFFLFLRRNVNQKHEIETLSRHKQFVENMPIPYTKAKVIYDEKKQNVLNIKYTLSNQAFDDILRENSTAGAPYVLFSPDFISRKTTELIETGSAISFLHYLNNTDTYYVFTLCLVDSKRGKDRDCVDNIDIFAIDVTKRQKAELDLKEITKKLDMTINVANLIPWEWNVKTDMMIFDAYSIFQRFSRKFDDDNYRKEQSKLTVADFMKLIYPDDKALVRRNREQLLLGEVSDFSMQYRLMLARQNQEFVEWVDVRGAVTRRDAEGRPEIVMGSMMVITDRKKQESEVIEAKRSSALAELTKANFLTDISREVRIQLNAIVGFASLMSETEDAEKRREFADIINTNNDQLLEYIDDLVTQGQTSAIEDTSYDMESAKSIKMEAKKAEKQAAQPENIQPAPATQPEVTKPSAAAHARNSNKKLILIAEDIEGNFLLLKHFIPKDYDIIHAWTGKEALDMFKYEKPDLILMDIGMPVMDGYKATSEIRKIDKNVPIVAVTAYTYASDRELILNSGFDDYISKPVARDTILDALRRYLK